MNHELLPELLAKAHQLTLDEQLQLMTQIKQMVRQHPPEESDRLERKFLALAVSNASSLNVREQAAHTKGRDDSLATPTFPDRLPPASDNLEQTWAEREA